MLTKFSWLNWVRTFSTQPARGRRAKAKTHQAVMVEPLEPRAMLAATAFDTGTLTIDFSAADETVTLSNNGTNITVASTDTVTGAGNTFTTGTVTRVVVTDSGNFGNQAFAISGSANYSLSGGLDVTGAERFQLSRAVATATAGASVVVSEQMDLFAALTATDGNIFLSANQQTQATSGSFFGIDVFGGSVTTSGTGTVTLLGRGGDTGITQIGVRVDGGGFVSGASTMVTGTGGASSGVANWGVYVSGFPNNSTITSTGGNVTVNGTGGGVSGSSQNIGVRVVNGGTVTADGTGAVNIVGTGGVGSSSHGVEVAASPTADIGQITTNAGALSINATAANSSSMAVRVGANGRLATGSGANLTVTADTVFIDSTSGAVDAGAGTATFLTRTAGRAIGLGSGSVAGVALGFASDELNRVTAGTLVIGDATAGNITISTAIAPTGTSQLELVTGGSILDSNATGDDLTVARLGMTASTGIGATNTLETAVGNLEATTATGGIFVSNTGDLVVGGVNSTLSGLTVTGASGAIQLTNAGSVLVSQQVQSAAADVSINATGSTSNLMVQAGSVSATTGVRAATTLTLQAGQDVLLGAAGSRGSLQASGISITSGRDFVADANTFVIATGTGGIQVTTGGDFKMLQAVAAGSLFNSNSSGAITINVAAGHAFTLDVGSVALNSRIAANSGPVIITADDVSIVSGQVLSNSTITVKQATAARGIDLGTNAAGVLGLTDSELDKIIGSGLFIGDSSSGTITVSQPITYVRNLTLTTGADVAVNNSLTLDVDKSLTINAVDTINLSGSSADLVLSGTGVAALTTLRNIQIIDGSVTSVDGNILLKANEQGTSAGMFIGIDVSGGSVTTTGTGTVTLLGRGGNGSNSNAGIRVVLGAAITGKSTSVTGYGGASAGPANYGVYVTGANSKISSSGGNVQVIGQGATTGDSQNYGVYVVFSGAIKASGSGTVSVTGTGGGGNSSDGVFVGSAETTDSLISSSGGTVSIDGSASGDSNGVRVASRGIIATGVNANLSIATDSIVIGGAINAGLGDTTLTPKTAGRVISLGAASVNGSSLGLQSVELNRITTSRLIIGNASAGDITSRSAINPNSVQQLELVTGGQIIDGNTTGTDISVAKLGLTAGTGIGVGNALDTGVSFLEATTVSGGIAIANSGGGLTIGAVNSTLAGLRVTGSSGGIDLQNTGGDVRVTLGGDLVRAPGNVSIRTLTSGNIVTANNNGFTFASFAGSINSSGGDVTLNAVGNIDLGETANGNTNGDVMSAGNLSITAGGSITADDQASIQATGSGVTITLNAGTDISVLHTHAGGSIIANQNLSGGLISARTGAGGTFTLDGGSSNPGIFSGAAGLRIAADNMSILDDIVFFNGGNVTFTTTTAGRQIDLGTNTSGALGLTSSEINFVTTAGSLTIGDSSSGSITFSDSLTPIITTVNLVTGGSIVSTTSSGTDLTASAMSITAATGIGSSTNPLKFNVDNIGTDTRDSNGDQFLSESNLALLTSSTQSLQAGTGTITLAGGDFRLAGGGISAANLTGSSSATLSGTGSVNANVAGALTVAPGASPGILTINGDFTPTGTVAFEVNPPAATAGTDYDQIVVNGAVDLSGATLTLTGTTGTVAVNQLVSLILNDGTDPITPATNFVDGQVVTINGNTYRLFYNGSDGNDLVLIENSAPAVVYVDDSFTASAGVTITDADQGTTGDQSAVFGISAFNTIAAALAAVSSSGTVIVNAGSYTETVSVNGTKTLQVGGADAAQAVSISDLASISGTTLMLAGSSSLAFGNATDRTLAGLISGSGSLTKQGASVVTVSGNNTYSGLTTISAGTLRVTANNALGTTAAGTSVASVGILELRNVSYSTAEAVTIAGGTILATSGTSTFAGTITMTASSNFRGNSSVLVLTGAVLGSFQVIKNDSGTLRLSNTGNTFANVNIGGGTLQLGAAGVIPDTADIVNSSTFDVNGFDETLDSLGGNGTIGNSQATLVTLTIGAGNNNSSSIQNGAISGAINLRKIGTGRQVLGAGGSTFTGTVTIDSGTLAVSREGGGGAVQGLGAASGGTTVNAGGILEFQSVLYALAEPITVNGGTIRATFSTSSFGGTITLATATATFNLTTGATLTLNGAISGDQALTKTGVGTLILGTTNTYTGATTVNGGTLLVNGSLDAGSSVAVNNSGTLGGSGTVNGSVNVASGGKVSPGNSPGVLNTGSVTFAAGSSFIAEINGTSAGTFDQLNVTGAVSLGNATLTLSGTITSNIGQQIVLINNDDDGDMVTGTFNNLPEGSIVAVNGLAFQLSYAAGTGGNDVVLTEIANYNVFLDNDGNLVFTDLLGNIADDFSISFNGTSYILTDTTQKLFTLIANATGSGTNTVIVPAASITGTGIILNGQGGADTLTVTYGASNFAHTVTVNGGTGSDNLRTTGTASAALSLNINGDANDDTVNLNADITFAADSFLNVDLEDDGATPGSDTISVGTNANMILSGTGGATLKASNTIDFATGSSIVTAGGNTVVETTTFSLAGSLTASAAPVSVTADSITITTNGLIDGQANTVTVRPMSAGTAIDLGADDTAGTLGLTAAELNRITAGTLVIGTASSGSITLSADITRAASTNVQLTSGGNIVQTSGAGSFNTAGGTLLLTPGGNASHLPNRAGTDLTATTVSYAAGSQVTIDIGGTTVDSEYTQLNVSGTANLTGVALNLTGSFASAFGNTFTIVAATSVTGQFSNFEDGSTFDFNGRTLRIDYANATVTLTDVTAQAPTLTMAGNITYIENDPATAIAAGIVVNDLDNATLSSATLSLTTFVSGEDVLAFVNDGSTMGNISVASNAGGVLTLTSVDATATLAEWQAALRAVTYFNTSENPTTTTRLVTFSVNDGDLDSNALTSMVNITAVNDAPMLTTAGNITYTENDAATAIATGIVVNDFDSTTLASANIRINNFLAGEDVLGFVANSGTMGNIQLVSNDTRTIVLTSAGATATLAEWQAALRAVTYFNTSENPTNNQAVLVEFIVNDGTDDSNILTSMVTLAPVNDAPTLTTGAEITYTENDAATVIAAGIVVGDVDNGTLASATVTITNFVAGQDVLALAATTGIGNIVVSGNAGGVLTLTSAGATATRLQWQAALRSITYFNSSDNPNTTTRNVSFVINDGDMDSETLTSMVNVTAVNDAPMLTTPGNITYTENEAATVVAAGIMVDDLDNMTLASATVTITNFVSGEDVLAYAVTAGTGNIMVAMAGNGVVRLTSAGATATLMQWQTALRAITYQNSSENPALTQRTVTFVVNDGDLDSNTLTSTIDIVAVNDAPVLTVAGTVNHTENGPATVIAPSITVNDVDNATLNNATITITNFVAGQDVLAFTNDGSTMGNIAVPSNANGVLTLTSAGGSATVAQWQAALRSVTYANTSEAPTTTTRNVTFVVRDKDANSNTLTSTVSITAVNDAPVLAVPGAVTFTEGLPAVAIATGLTVTDLDSTLTTATVTITNFVAGQDVLAFTNDGSTMGNIAVTVNVGESLTLTSAGGSATLAQWQAALRAVTYANTSQVPNTTTRSITFVVNDGVGDSNTLTSTVSVVDTGLPQEWVINGLRARLGQNGDDLVLTNEFGMVSRGRVVSPTQIVALDWGNLVGNLTNNGQRIEWANGTVWDVPVPPAANTMLDISGGWKINGLLAQILQKGRELTLINEFGQTVAARLSDDNQTIIATGWGITGNIVGDQILWSNQTQWSRASFPIPTLSQNWLIGNNQHTEINVQPNPAELLLKNEFGALSRAVFTSSTQIFATDWKLTGTFTAGNTAINWANGTQWTADTSAMDSLFASDFDPFN